MTPRIPVVRDLRPQLVAGGAVLLLGLSVMAGYLLKSPLLVQVASGAACMQFQTALCFTLGGAALLSGGTRWRPFVGGAVLLVAVAALIANLTGVSFGLDLPSLHAWIADGSPNPGRMALNTSVAFVLAGLALITLTRRQISPRGALLIRICVAGVFLVGALGAFGYLLDLESLYEWYQGSRMAAHTAAGLIVLAAGLWSAVSELGGAPVFGPIDHRIALVGASVVIAVALTSGLVGFATLEYRIQDAEVHDSRRAIAVQLPLTVAALLLLALAGAVVLYRQVRPLAANLVRSEEQARHLASELADKEQRMRAVVDNVAEAVITIDETGCICSFNKAASEMFGYTLDETVGRNITMLMPESTRVPHEHGMQRYLQTGEARVIGTRGIELPGLRKDGAVIDVMLSISEAGVGGSRRFLGVVCDITEQKRARDALADSERRLRLALNGSQLSLFDWDIATGVVHLSEQGPKFIGAPPDWTRTTMQELEALVHPDDLAGLKQALVATLKGMSSHHRAEYRVRTVSGDFKWIGTHAEVVQRSKDNRALKMIGTMADISRRKEAEQQREQQRQLLNAVLDNVQAGIVACDNEGVLTLFNEAAKRFHGLLQEPLSAERWAKYYDLFLPDGETPMSTEDVPLFRALRGERVYDAEMMIVPKGGLVARTLLANGCAMFGADGKKLGAVVAMHDITARKRMEARLEFLAWSDALTGLPNRGRFQDLLAAAMARCRRSRALLALMFLDIDHFKRINDDFGHAAGDQVLRRFAAHLRRNVRETDAVSRLAGDEFTIILENLHHQEDATAVARKIITTKESTVPFEEGNIPVTTSVGIAFYTGAPSTSAATLMQQADGALYRAKQAGRATFCLAD